MSFLNSLDQLKHSNKKKKYTYKNISFLTNIEKKDYLVVMFHGISNINIYPVFRGYDYYFNNANVLSITDPLVKYYPQLKIGWYLNTIKYPKTTETVIEIVKHIKKICNSKKIIFVSNCSGALFALKLSCMLNEICLIANPHTIIKSSDCWDHYHWNDESLEKGYRMPLMKEDNYKKVNILNEIIKKNDDKILSFNDLDGRNYFKRYGFPLYLLGYTHKNDYTAKWLIKIKECYNDNKNIKIIFNDVITNKPHHSPFMNSNLRNEVNILLNEL